MIEYKMHRLTSPSHTIQKMAPTYPSQIKPKLPATRIGVAITIRAANPQGPFRGTAWQPPPTSTPAPRSHPLPWSLALVSLLTSWLVRRKGDLCTHCCRIIGILTQLAAATAAKGTQRATKGGAFCWRKGTMGLVEARCKVRVEGLTDYKTRVTATHPDTHLGTQTS